jgi:hypothetical protein
VRLLDSEPGDNWIGFSPIPLGKVGLILADRYEVQPPAKGDARRMIQASLSTSYWPSDTSEEVLETTVGSVLRDAARRSPSSAALV